ncbi:MAG: DUF4275 family protein [Candidatus Methanoplasma sp.]|nr:DUF4275 family protein [Candidatus Methanoplasma sp.]
MGKKITVREFIVLLRRSGIETVELSPSEIKGYKNRWYRTFVSPAKDSGRLRAVCLGIDDDLRIHPGCGKDARESGFKGFLWHVYRYEAIIDYKKGIYARAAFNRQLKKNMILVDNFSRENTAFLIRDAPGIRAEDLDNLTDATITDVDYAWTYSKTHEEEWFGPYFYKKRV